VLVEVRAAAFNSTDAVTPRPEALPSSISRVGWWHAVCSTIDAGDGSRQPGDRELEIARHQGEPVVAKVTARLNR
jgi:hypothetical protein